MTLLDTVIAATGAGASSTPDNVPENHPILLDLDDIYPKLTPADLNTDDAPTTTTDPSPLHRLTGWEASGPNADFTKPLKKLAKMLKNPKSTNKDKVWTFLNSSFTVAKLSPFAGTRVVSLVADACVEFELWEMLETMITNGFFATGGDGLVKKLVGRKLIGLVLVYLKHLTDPLASDVEVILGCFLNPTKETYGWMVQVRKELERQGLFAIEKAVEGGMPKKKAILWREAAILLMMAYDGFTASECCLHYLFSKEGLKGLTMASAVKGLSGEEVTRLVGYFKKWMGKYQRFPEAVPCVTASEKLGLVACESIPTLENVVAGLTLVVDQRFEYLVRNPELHGEIKALEDVVSSLASGANACCRLANVIETLQNNEALSR